VKKKRKAGERDAYGQEDNDGEKGETITQMGLSSSPSPLDATRKWMEGMEGKSRK
jgi:hypothetical protein